MLRSRSIREISVPSAQLFCELKTYLKNSLFKKRKKRKEKPHASYMKILSFPYLEMQNEQSSHIASQKTWKYPSVI